MKKLIGLTGIFVALVCLGMSCGKEEINSSIENLPDEKDSLSIQIGDTVQFSNGYKLSFNNLVEDSRCPANAMCIWQGRVIVELQAEKGGEILEFTLSTDPSYPEQIKAEALGYEITLINVLPYPGTTLEEVQPGDYFVELKLKRLSH